MIILDSRLKIQDPGKKLNIMAIIILIIAMTGILSKVSFGCDDCYGDPPGGGDPRCYGCACNDYECWWELNYWCECGLDFECPTNQHCCVFFDWFINDYTCNCYGCCGEGQCPTGQHCCNLSCHECCDPSHCIAQGKVCVSGQCVPCQDPAHPCPLGKYCVNGVCVDCRNYNDCSCGKSCANNQCVRILTETVSPSPENRNRTTLGIGEEVYCYTDPPVSVTWSKDGDGSISDNQGYFTFYISYHSPGSGKVYIPNNEPVGIPFTIIAPDGLAFSKNSDVGLGPEGPPNNYIGAYTIYNITVFPTTVSFYNNEFHENIPAQGFKWPNGVESSTPGYTVPWNDVHYDNTTIDNIKSGPYPIGYIHNGTNYVNFQYTITWSEEYLNQNNDWIEFFDNESKTTKFQGSDQKGQQILMGVEGSWQGPWIYP